MKKLLLLTLALGIGYVSVAQVNKLAPRKEINKMQTRTIADQSVMMNAGPTQQLNATTSGSKALNKTVFGSSANVITLIVSSSSCLSALPSYNTALFVARGGGSYGWTGDHVIGSFTKDKGATFGATQLPTINDATHSNRYPSGVLYKPAAATSADECFISYSGISHNAGTWDHDFFGSCRVDSTICNNVLYAPLDSPTRHEFSRINFQACNDGKVHVMGDAGVSGASPALYPGVSIWNGTFNTGTNNFDWTMTPLSVAAKNEASTGDDLISGWAMAWSDDGTIGYAVMYGIDSSTANVNNDWVPIVKKTINSGATWTLVPFFDFYASTPTTELKAKLDDWWTYVGHTGRPRVFFSSGSGDDALVDANGNLHLASLIQCGFSSHADSLGYTFMYEDRVIWDIFTTPTGWDAKTIDTILTLDVDAASGLQGSSPTGWDHRIQLSKSNNGERVFFTWADSDTSFFDMVMAPDLYIRGRDVNSGIITNEFSMTRGTAYDGANYWHFAATDVFEDATNYEIPLTTTTHGALSTDPCTHYYFSGVVVPKAAFVGVEENNSVISSISQNYPNPFSTTSTINVNLAKATTLSVEVTNIMGQKVMTINKGNVASGSHNVVIDGSKLTSGVYFYTVRAGENSVTRKMIVE
ncbi:MAG: T9SS type A sorting domain-containing protein [Bacteroidota bacterium]